MKHVHDMVSVRPALALLLGMLALPAAAHPQSGSTAAALDLHSALTTARAAARRDAWSALEGDLRLEGTTDTGGVDASFELFFTADGRFRLEQDGRLARTLTFDGRDVALRVRRGPTAVLALAERERWLVSQWVHSGFWIDERCPLAIELEGETAGDVTLRLSLPGSPSSSTLILERQTWLPRELRRTSLGSDAVVRFEEYEEVAGIPVAHLVRSTSHGETTDLRVRMGSAAEEDAQRYARSTAPPTDLRFDPDRPAEVELRRAQTGHLLVHPLVDGEDVGWFILDSGAGQICIDPQAADELGLERFGTVPAVGVAGAVTAAYRQGATLELGPLRLADPVYVEIDLAFLAPIFGVEVAGICGYEVFARSVVQLDLEELGLALFDPSTYELGVDAWTPLLLSNRIPVIGCRFEGDREGLFKIDLGDSGTISFYSPAVKALKLLEGRDVQPTQVGGVGGMSKASAGDLAWFELGGHRVEALPATFSQAEGGVFASSWALGNLGTEMLAPFLVVFDYANERIALVPRD